MFCTNCLFLTSFEPGSSVFESNLSTHCATTAAPIQLNIRRMSTLACIASVVPGCEPRPDELLDIPCQRATVI